MQRDRPIARVLAAAGRIRDLPVPLLIQELVAPMVIHMLLRPNTAYLPGVDLPDIDTVCDVFTDGFIRAAGNAPTSPKRPPRR